MSVSFVYRSLPKEAFIRQHSRRAFSSVKAPPAQPVVELREYDLIPEKAAEFMKLAAASSDLRKSLSPLRFFSVPETGGKLQVATHVYYYAGGFAERDEVRIMMARNREWQDFVLFTRSCLQCQKSTLFVEAPLVTEVGLPGLAHGVTQNIPSDDCILELRRYYLKLGYDTVPKFLELYGAGLPSKLMAVGTDPTTSLITLMYSEVGRMNEVIEVWRHGNGQSAMQRSRLAARGANDWRAAIASIADLAIEFSSTIHKPAMFSPLR